MSQAGGAPVPATKGQPRHRLIAIMAALVGACVVCFILGTRISNPQQAAASAAAPDIGPVTVPVERRVVSQAVSFAASVHEGDLPVSAPPRDDAALVVTGLPLRAGQAVVMGRPVVVVSGRPILALHGSLPAYRDLKEGMTGPDVSQLRAALDELGLSTRSDSRGTFGPATTTAVRGLYARAGFDAPTTGEDAPGSQDAPERRTPAAYLPREEALFVTGGAATVAAVRAGVGQQVSAGAPVLTLRTGQPLLTGTVDPSIASALEPGLSGVATDTTSGKEYPVVTASLPAPSGAAALGGTQHKGTGNEPDPADATTNVAVAFKGPSPAPEMAAGPFQVSVTIRRTPGEVLAVPVSAVSTTSDEKTVVVVLARDGTEDQVEVVAGLSGQGLVEISSPDRRLVAGSLVVLGHGPRRPGA